LLCEASFVWPWNQTATAVPSGATAPAIGSCGGSALLWDAIGFTSQEDPPIGFTPSRGRELLGSPCWVMKKT